MKKLITLLLAAALVLSLAACGGGSDTPSNDTNTTNTDTPTGETEMTKDEMLEQSEEITPEDLFGAAESNIVSAEETYGNKLITFTSQVFDIQKDHIKLGNGFSYINVSLPKEDIAKLENKQLITVVGQLGNSIEDISEKDANGFEIPKYCYEMKEAYLVADRFEYTGKLKGKNESYEGVWNIEYNNSPMILVIQFNESVDLSGYNEAYNSGEEITFTAKVFNLTYSNPGGFSDAIIIDNK